jgi:DNA polymerase I-like protein with 3'-5' exonuclease and polymerase domains
MLSVDSETTGLDLRHGASPFFVTMCEEDGTQHFWQWEVDPMTREVDILPDDLTDIASKIYKSDELILQNVKFDASVMHQYGLILEWPWGRTKCTLMAGHLLASNHKHNLTDMVMEYLGKDIEPYEKAVQDACMKARTLVRTKKFKLDHGDWAIAKEDREDMPSAKEKTWKFDMWLPKTVAEKLKYPKDHPWRTVTEDYANTDSASTLLLWKAQKNELERRGLWEIYLERLKVLPVAFRIETYGITGSKKRVTDKYLEYEEESERAHRICVNLSEGSLEKLPINGRSNALNDVIFNKFGLKSNKYTKKGGDSMDKTVLEHWMLTLDQKSKQWLFVKNLMDYRKRKTAMGYMNSYERFWMPIPGTEEFFRLHPFLNPTGTNTLRWSSNNPNEQNISKKEGFNLRYCFGPIDGREWWSCDAQNIELRLPAYEAREGEMIALFERPNDPPYFGSNHLLISHILWPKEFEACRNERGELDGRIFKKKYADTLYQWVKNGNFAVQYGAVEASGTADRAYHQDGAQHKVQKRFRGISDLNQWCINFANKHGYIETIPDKRLGGKKGYPLLCTRTSYGKILETVPLNYRIQGTACWWMQSAMIRVQELFDKWRRETGFEAYIIMQVHDEMVFDFPKASDPKKNPKGSNLWRIREVQKLMAMGGDDIGIPTPVSAEYHENNWSVGSTV